MSVRGMGDIDGHGNDREWPSEAGMSNRDGDARGPRASTQRVRRSSANEWHEGAWYGDPEGRQEK